jgi:hypothetical protein
MKHRDFADKEVFTMSLPNHRTVLSTIVASLAMLAPAAPSAQETPKQAPHAESTSVSDKELRAFAIAYVQYQRIRQSYEPRIDKLRDAKEKEKLQREGDAKVKEALQRQGLTPESYNRLFAAVNGNERLRRKALKWIDEERSQS